MELTAALRHGGRAESVRLAAIVVGAPGLNGRVDVWLQQLRERPSCASGKLAWRKEKAGFRGGKGESGGTSGKIRDMQHNRDEGDQRKWQRSHPQVIVQSNTQAMRPFACFHSCRKHWENPFKEYSFYRVLIGMLTMPKGGMPVKSERNTGIALHH
jgi:hypothetical protein